MVKKSLMLIENRCTHHTMRLVSAGRVTHHTEIYEMLDIG